MNNLGMDLFDLKKYDEAADFLKRAIEGRVRLLGPKHEDTRLSQINLIESIQHNQTLSPLTSFSDPFLIVKRESLALTMLEP